MPRLTAGRGRGGERRKKRRQERRKEGGEETLRMNRTICPGGSKGEKIRREAEIWSELSNMPQAGLRRDAGR